MDAITFCIFISIPFVIKLVKFFAPLVNRSSGSSGDTDSSGFFPMHAVNHPYEQIAYKRSRKKANEMIAMDLPLSISWPCVPPFPKMFGRRILLSQ